MYMNAQRTILTLGTALFLAAGLQGPVHGATSELATVSTTSGGIHWQPLVATDGWTLTVAGEERWIRSQFGSGESPAFRPADDSGQPLPDGTYTWELRAVYRGSGGDPNAAASGRDGTTNTSRTRAAPSGPHTQSGAFTIFNGAIAVEETETGTGVETGGTAATGGGSQEGFAVFDDLFVHSSACVGIDCVVNGESFGADTIRLKENNLRIHFLDTSNSGSFPSNDWRLVANDQANGGRNVFYLEDATSGREVLSVEAGAPTSSLYVDDAGRVGFGTSTPALELHAVDGDTPTLRLDQDGSSGFTPQTWDVAGNETNFFVRDVTNASRLPFRVRPGAPTSSIDVAANGNVGMGTDSPSAPLHIVRTGATTDRQMIALTNDGGSRVDFLNTNTGNNWRFATESASDSFVVTKIGSGQIEMRIDSAGNLTIPGTLSQGSDIRRKFDIVPVNASAILERVSELPIAFWRYRGDTSQARHIGPMAQDFARLFDVGIDKVSISALDSAGIALAAVQALTGRLSEKQKELDQLTTTSERIARESSRISAENDALHRRIDRLEQSVRALLDDR